MKGVLERLREVVAGCWPRRKARVDILVWMQECPYTDAIIAQVSKARPNSLVVVASLFHGQFFAYHPPGLSFRHRPLLDVFSRLNWKNVRLAYLFYPFYLVLAYPAMVVFYLWLALRFRVKSVLIFDHQQAAVVGMMRRLGLFERVVFFAGDWYPGSTFRKGIWTRIGNEVYFPAVDWIACRCCDVTINQTDFVKDGRTRYWGRQVPRQETGFVFPLIIKCKDIPARLRGHKVLFLGASRSDSGLALVLEALLKVRERVGNVSLKIVGPSSPTIDGLQRSAAASGLSGLVEYMGICDYANYETLFSDCYCGINLITDPQSYSSRAIPAKIPDYWQSLLPVLLTPYVGPLAETTTRNALGLVVEPTVESVAAGLIEIFEKRATFVENIRTFIQNRTSTDFAKLLCPEPPERSG